MKCFLALALLVGAVVSNSLNFYAWRPDQELVYKFESQTLSGIPEIRDSQFSGVKIQSDVIVQTFRDFTIRVKLANAKYISVNEEQLNRVDGRIRLPEANQELPGQFGQFLSRPFKANLKRGVVESFETDAQEPESVTNIKKSVLSQLQLDISGLRRSEIESNLIPSGGASHPETSDKPLTGDEESFFTTAESTVSGDCRTDYTVTRMSEEQVRQMESAAEQKRERLQQEGLPAPKWMGLKGQAARQCAGKPHFEVVKNKDLNECVHRPVFQISTGLQGKCDYSKNGCGDLMTHTTTTRYVICGSREEFYIRESQADDIVLANPLAWTTGDEKMASVTSISLYLAEVKQGGFSPMSTPSGGKRLLSLVFEYGTGRPLSSQPGSRNETNINGIREKPDLTSESNIFPQYVPFGEMKQQVREQIKEIVQIMFKSPESCSNSKDIAGKIVSIAQSLRARSLEQLKQVDSEISSLFPSEEKLQQLAENIFSDILAMTGSNPSVVLVLEKVERMQQRAESSIITEITARRYLSSTIRNVFSPTEQLLEHIFQKVKSFRGNADLYARGMTQLSSLVHSACMSKGFREAMFPVRIYGEFCNEKSQIIVSQMVPYLEREISQSSGSSSSSGNGEYLTLVHISALGKIGHVKALPTLARIVEGKLSGISQTGRVLAVHSMKRMARQEPNVVRPVLLKTIDNPAENTEVRIAAVAVLPFAQPSVHELQKIAVRSWFEPSKQVASFIYTTFKSLTQTTVPELVSVGNNAKTLLSLVKPFQTGITFAQTAHSDNFVAYLQSAASGQVSYSNSEYQVVPGRISLSSRFFGQSWQINGLTLTTYLEGMEKVYEKIVEKTQLKSETNSQVQQKLKSIDEQLKIQWGSSSGSPSKSDPKAFIQLNAVGYDLVGFFDIASYEKMMEQVSETLANTPDAFSQKNNVDFTNAISYVNVEGFGPTESGLAMYVQRSIPLVYGAKGTITLDGRMGEKSSLKTDLKKIINGKMMANMGHVLPFSKQYLGVGVEASVHACIPLQSEVSLDRSGKVEMVVQAVDKNQDTLELVHFFMKPYTVKSSLQHVTPISKGSDLKKITTGRSRIGKNWQLGSSMGIKSNLKIDADYQNLDFATIYSGLKQHNGFSAATLGWVIPTVKDMSVRLTWSPRDSSTKEIDVSLNILTGSKSQSGQIKVHQPSAIALEKSLQTIESECREQHTSSLQISKCVSKKTSQQSGLKVGSQKVEEMLQKISEKIQQQGGQQIGSIKSIGINIEAGLSTRSERKSVRAAIVGGSKKQEISGGSSSSGQKQEQINCFLDAHLSGSGNIQSGIVSGSNSYAIEMESKINLPTISSRWNVEQILQRPVKMEYELITKYGPSRSSKKEIVLKSEFVKTQQMKDSVRHSSEFKRCQHENDQGRPLASVCEELRHQAASVNKANLKIKLPNSLAQSQIVQKLQAGAKAFFVSELFEMQPRSSSSSASQSEYEIELVVNRQSTASNVTVWSPNDRFNLTNIRIPSSLSGFFPLSLRNGVSLRIVQDLTRDQSPASCRLDTRQISTFDNRTYGYHINDCPHLLFKDCVASDIQESIAVQARAIRSGRDEREVEILSGQNQIVLTPTGGVGSLTVRVNGQNINVPSIESGRPFEKRDSQQRVVLAITRYQDGIVKVSNPTQRVIVFFDGERIEIVAPKYLLKDRSCGLCGDNNGETTADLRTPQKCVLSQPRFSAYSYMKKNSGCSGIPSQDRQQYEREISQCFTKKELNTPVEQLSKRMINSSPRAFSLTHLVEEHSTEICFSQKQVSLCPQDSVPTEVKALAMPFVCLDKYSAAGQALRKQAEYGQPLPELQGQHIQYRQRVLEPVKCSQKNRQ